MVGEVPVKIKAFKIVPSVTGKEVYVSKVCPFGNGRLRYYNQYYLTLVSNVEENRNRIILRSGKDIVPANIQGIALLLDETVKKAHNIMEQFLEEGVIGLFKAGAKSGYYVNPKYAFCGKEIPEFLMHMFHVTQADLEAFDTAWFLLRKELEDGC